MAIDGPVSIEECNCGCFRIADAFDETVAEIRGEFSLAKDVEIYLNAIKLLDGYHLDAYCGSCGGPLEEHLDTICEKCTQRKAINRRNTLIAMLKTGLRRAIDVKDVKEISKILQDR